MEQHNSITIRFYEELNDFLTNYPKKQDISYSYIGMRSVKDLIENFGVPHVEVELILINGEPVTFDYHVKDRDRISVYPMFERFNMLKTSLLRDYNLRQNKFIADVHLGKLARHLRLLGFDTDYNNNRDDPELARISSEQHRILLTRDRQLLMRKIVQWGVIIRSDDPREQIVEVIKKIDLWDEIHPFTRCLSCNGIIQRLPSQSSLYDSMKSLIPLKVQLWCKEYTYCPSCKKVYWKGSHYDSLMKRIGRLKHQSGNTLFL